MYSFETTDKFYKQLGKIDKSNARFILKYIKNKIGNVENPWIYGETPGEDTAGIVRYRIGDYRLICKIEDDKLLILALSLGYRREIYR